MEGQSLSDNSVSIAGPVQLCIMSGSVTNRKKSEMAIYTDVVGHKILQNPVLYFLMHFIKREIFLA